MSLLTLTLNKMNRYYFNRLESHNINAKDIFFDIIDEVYSEYPSKHIFEFMNQTDPNMDVNQLMQLLQQNIDQDPNLKQRVGDKFNQLNQVLVQLNQNQAQGQAQGESPKQFQNNPNGGTTLMQTRQMANQSNSSSYKNQNYKNPNYKSN